MTSLCRMCATVAEPVASLLDPNLEWVVEQLNIEITPDLPNHVCKICLQEIHAWFVSCHRSKLAQGFFDKFNLKYSNSTSAIEKPTSNECKTVEKPTVNLSQECKTVENDSKSELELKEFSIKIERLNNKTIEKCTEKLDIEILIKNKLKTKKGYKCNLCKKIIIQRLNFINHYKRHMNLCLFHCNICDKKFAGKHELKKHVDVVHANQRKYVCSKCKMTFKAKQHLTKHLKRHDIRELAWQDLIHK